MRIMSVTFIDEEGVKKEIDLKDMTPRAYRSKFKGKLFCPMKGCQAKISYSGGKYPHFRTWRYEKHSVDCLFYFDRIPMNLGRNTTSTISVEISPARRKKALEDAFIQMNLSEEEKEAQRQNRSNPRMRTRKVTKAKQNVRSVQQVLFGADYFDDELIYRRRNILKRAVDEIRERDLGRVFLITGQVNRCKEIDDAAEIIVENNNRIITVVFEEAFTAEPLNSSYLNKFWAISRLLERERLVQFTGIGELRKSSKKNRLELVIYSGSDLQVNGMDISAVATRFALERYRLQMMG